MPLQIGIIGLPNVGKSTLFNVLTKSKGAEAANYPFCTIEPNVGIVEVPDERIDTLVSMVKPAKVIPAAIEFKDIAGLVKGASKGEGLGNQFLAAIREVHALCHVVRFFEDAGVIHVEGNIGPLRDREIVEAELCIADLESLGRRAEKMRGAAKTGDKEKQRQLLLIDNVLQALGEGKMASGVEVSDEEQAFMKEFTLLTDKPILYAANVSEQQLKDFDVTKTKSLLGLSDEAEIVAISAKIEEDLQDLSPEEIKAFLSELGVSSSGLDRLIRSAYRALGYITFFTAGPKEVRAWNIPKGSKAPQAAGTIHTDFEKGFIRAETISYKDFVQYGGETGAKEAGRMRSEGKEYVVQDGDVMHFRFNV